MLKRIFLVGFILIVFSKQSWSGAFELSSGFSYSRSYYSELSYSWTKRFGFAFGYFFYERSEVEIAYQDIVERNYISGFEDTTFHDRIYSVNLVQSFTGKSAAIQPYIKIGIGQLNRDAVGTYIGGYAPPVSVDSVTGVLGVGLRLYVTRTFAIRSEATSYLAGGSVRNWKNNIVINFGLSVVF
ncbi:MAG: hypothetical protein HY072_07335 [Deltaproteobacteria bacterium]|nr:hypothetical protein [Deltaproteobacteria bacterium]